MSFPTTYIEQLKHILFYFSSGNDSTLVNNTVLRCCAGLCIDLLKTLSTQMKFDFNLYEVPDQTWGLPDQVRLTCCAKPNKKIIESMNKYYTISPVTLSCLLSLYM